MRGVDGVADVEPTTTLPVTVTGPEGAYATVLEVHPADTTLRSLSVVEGDTAGFGSDGLLLGTAMQDLLGVGVGDTVEVRVEDPTGGGTLLTLEGPVTGFVQETLGTSVYASTATLARLAGTEVPTTGALVALQDGADGAAVRDRIEALDVVASSQSSAAIRELLDDVTGLLVGFVSIMLACGAVLAGTMIFTTVSVSIAERTREVATLRASGVPTRTIARLITTENLVVALLGIVPGVLLGLVGGRAMMATYTTDQFAFAFMVAPTTVVVSVLALLAVAAASQLPGLRSLSRLDLAQTVRERTAYPPPCGASAERQLTIWPAWLPGLPAASDHPNALRAPRTERSPHAAPTPPRPVSPPLLALALAATGCQLGIASAVTTGPATFYGQRLPARHGHRPRTPRRRGRGGVVVVQRCAGRRPR